MSDGDKPNSSNWNDLMVMGNNVLRLVLDSPHWVLWTAVRKKEEE